MSNTDIVKLRWEFQICRGDTGNNYFWSGHCTQNKNIKMFSSKRFSTREEALDNLTETLSFYSIDFKLV